MTMSEGIKKFLEQYSDKRTDEEKAEHQKLIDSGAIVVHVDHAIDSEYNKQYVEFIRDWEKSVEEHGGDRNWAVKEYAKKKGWI